MGHISRYINAAIAIPLANLYSLNVQLCTENTLTVYCKPAVHIAAFVPLNI